MNSGINKHYQFGVQDMIANRVYQAFERLQIAWYTANARRPVDAQLDDTSITELKAAEEQWLAARSEVCTGC